MSPNDYDDDGEKITRRKPQRLTKSGKPDRRSPPKANQFKPGQSGNPEGARIHRRTSNSSKGKRVTVDEILATEVTLPSGEQMSMDEVIIRRQIKAAADGSTAAFKALAAARKHSGGPEPESPEILKQREELSAEIMKLVEAGTKLKRLGLLSKTSGGYLTLAPWIYAERRRRVAEGIDPPTADDLFEEKKRKHAEEQRLKIEGK